VAGGEEGDREAPPHVRRLLRLLRGGPRLRHKAGARRVLAEGPHLLEEALAAGLPVDLLVLSPRGERALAPDTLRRATAVATEVVTVSERAVADLADTQTPRGVLSVVRLPEAPAARPAAGELWVVLVAVRDPRNVGAIARTAWAAGATGIAAVGGAAFSDAKALRASQGALFHLPTVEVAAGELAAWHGGRLSVYACVPAGGAPPWQADLAGGGILLLGSEGQGLPDDLRQGAAALSLPLAPGVQSLGVAAAAAAVLYEAVRQRTAAVSGRGTLPARPGG
jgi:TrmH family RNA methyltransferase